MPKINRNTVLRESKDIVFITVGLACYAMGWSAFLLPYQITTGGVTGIAAIVFYATSEYSATGEIITKGFAMQYTYFLINSALIIFAFKILGTRFTLKTIYAIFMMTFLLGFFQQLIGNVKIIGEGQEFMACVVGAALCGIGLGIVFINNGSTGGTDIIAAVVNKYRDITFGRMILYCDVIIISSCYFIFHDWKRVVFGFVTLIVISYVLDLIVNSARQSVQFLIFSKKYDQIADRIISETRRGVTVLDGTGWYSKNNVKVMMVMAKKSQSVFIFRLIKDIDPDAFISQSSVIGVYGEGFDRIKVK